MNYDVIVVGASFAGLSAAMQLGCTIEQTSVGTMISVDEQQDTSVKGVYAAGEAANMKWNATIAAASGVMAGVSAHQSLVFDN